MILRVPDYYDKFQCIASACKDSCCVGWEIDIDEDTHDYYDKAKGAFGERLRKNMYVTEDGAYSFRLKQHGRCPFLNEQNLCDICIEMGEESLSEVCTEYPRFTTLYRDVMQKCLSLSCEEVGRILFSRTDAVAFVQHAMPDMEEWEDDNNEFYCAFLEEAQEKLLAILQNREISLTRREQIFLEYARQLQQVLTRQDWENVCEKIPCPPYQGSTEDAVEDGGEGMDSFEMFDQRFSVFEKMEVLNQEWTMTKKQVRKVLTADRYETLLREFLETVPHLDEDYEQLLVYFTFRYFMQTVYDYNLLEKAKLAVLFTHTIRDLDVVRYVQNGRRYTREDRVDVARIFSKEVEHSEENIELAAEELCLS